MRKFENQHPCLLFTYFIIIIGITMFSLQPVLILISLLIAILYTLSLLGLKKTLISLAYSTPILMIITITNPIFVHQGETILFFLNDKPFTKEALVYGFVAGSMLLAIFYWFKCFHQILTADKIIFLFGRVVPKISLLLSMVFAFIPKVKKQFYTVDEAQRSLGIYTSKSYTERIKNRLRIFSILLTWSLESSIETSQSMKARGYGLKGRSNYHNYKWYNRDTYFAFTSLFLFSFLTYLIIQGYIDYYFYPFLKILTNDFISFTLYGVWATLLTLPLIIDIKEKIKWNYLRSKI